MEFLTSIGEIISRYGNSCPEFLCDIERSGGFSNAELKNFRQLGYEMDVMTSNVWGYLSGIPKDATGVLALLISTKDRTPIAFGFLSDEE
jgi:hypothetical protein